MAAPNPPSPLELAAMAGESDFEAGLASLSAKVPMLAVTLAKAASLELGREW